MSIVQVRLNQVLSAFKECLHSIDLRTAIAQKDKDDKVENLLTGIRISARPVSVVNDRHFKLLQDLGPGKASSFKVLYDALPFTSIDNILSELAEGMLTVAGHRISFPQVIEFHTLRGNIDRHQRFVRGWGTSSAPAFYSYLKFTTPSSQPELLTADIRRAFGVRSVSEAVDAFLELEYSGQESVNLFFIYVEMPARIASASLSGSTIKVQVEAEKHLRAPRLCVNRYDPSGRRLLESRVPNFEIVQEDDQTVFFNAVAPFGSMHDSDTISCVLTHDQLPEIDEVTNSAHDLMQAEERNPLLESLRKFWDINKLYEQAVQPFLTKPTKIDVRSQDVFQKAIARLLNLAGFQAIDLERQDRIYHPETKVERATVDLLAYHAPEKILLLGACTIGVPKTEDYEKLLHAREIFKATLTAEAPLYIAPVLFTMQENVSPFRIDMANVGLRVLNTRDLEALAKLINAGKQVTFIYFLKSPTSTTLADRT